MAHQRNNENLRKEEVLQAFVNERNKVQDNPPQTNNPNLNNKKEPAPVHQEHQEHQEQHQEHTQDSTKHNEEMPASSNNTGEEK